jgi:hypothetical protein
MPEGALPLIPVIWHLIGAVAQLGERLLCKQEVTGSIPVGSTREPDVRHQGSEQRCDGFGWRFGSAGIASWTGRVRDLF